MTGGARGFCNPSGRYYVPPGFGGIRGFGGGFGQGSERGRGFGRGFGGSRAYPPTGGWYEPAYNAPYERPYSMRPEDEVNMLRGEADAIKSELDAINKRIEELEAESAEK
jgi:hypothetical protein